MSLLHTLVWWTVCLCLLPRMCHAQLTVSAIFNQGGVKGSIEFSQDTSTAATNITVNLTGLANVEGATSFPWHVHEFPFPHNAQWNPCRSQITGGHYDPLGQNMGSNYTQLCSEDRTRCEVGDLSGRLGLLTLSGQAQLTDSLLSLYGVYSIIGRSVVLHYPNQTRFVCANIGYPPSADGVDLLYVPFRDTFPGNMYFRQHTDGSTASVFTDLASGSGNSSGHNWHIHENPVDMDCEMAGGHYNPRGVNASSSQYSALCNPGNQTNCEIGDLAGKSSPLDVRGGVVMHFYTDTDLPLSAGGSEGFSIANRSVVIHETNRGPARIACANIARFLPLEAEAVFTGQDSSGIIGRIRFSQVSPFDPTRVDVNLAGLRVMAGGYHVHVTPIGPAVVGFPGRCNVTYAGGHWNPLGVVYGDGEEGLPQTSDEYEVGDLSGKFDSLAGLEQIGASYYDPNLPLFGALGIIGRSIVIHMDDSSGTRWVCADIGHTRPVVEVRFTIQSGNFTGQVTLLQPAGDPLADTTIIVELDRLGNLEPPPPPQVTSSEVVATPVVSSTPSPSMATSLVASISPTPSIVVTGSSVLPSSSEVEIQPTTPPLAPTPSPSPSMPSVMAMPLSAVTVLPSSTAIPSRRRRSSSDEPLRRRSKRQAASPAVMFNWGLRVGVVMGDTGCDDLPLLGPLPANPDLCSPERPLLCSAGDLTSKHGPLNFPRDGGSLRVVFTDPNLPLSGPGAAFDDSSSPVSLLIEPLPGQTQSDVVLCSGNPVVTIQVPPTVPPPVTTPPTTPSSAPPTTPPVSPTPEASGSIVGAVVGGVVTAILLAVLVIVVVLIVVWCWMRKTRSKYDLNKASQLEMGTRTPSKPILGVPSYKVIHHYEPQNDDDLGLAIGEWVTLDETPYGGGWWLGTVEGKGSGWFPKTYVEYVDREAEKKRKQDESFTLAAAAIMGASSSFSTHHPSMSTRRASEAVQSRKSKQPKRAHTFNKTEIDSTPKMVSKFDKPYLEREDVTVIENMMKDTASISGGSRPDTPGSITRNEIITNTQAAESGSSQEDNFDEQVRAQLNFELAKDGGDLMPHADKHVAKYDFVGTTDIELHFKKGNVIQVLEKADNGWWQGVCQGQVGWFPESYVDPVPIKAAVKTGSREEGGAPDAEVEKPRNMDETMAADGDLEALEYHAVFSYQSATEGDLVFSEGDAVLVYWAQDNGWWYGTSGGNEPGWFPGSHVEPIIDTSTAKAEGSVMDPASAMPDTKRAPSSDSQDSGVGQEDENKSEDSGKPSGLQGELASALLKRNSVPLNRDHETKAAQSAEVTEPSQPSQQKPKQPPPVGKKPKPVKLRRESAPAKSHHRRKAPLPPPEGGTPTQTQKVPKEAEPSPQVPRTELPAASPNEEKPELEEQATKTTPELGPELSAPQLTATKPTAGEPGVEEALSSLPKPRAVKPATPTAGKVPKRRTSAAPNRVTPWRRPPPPVPPALLEAAALKETPTSRVSEDGGKFRLDTPTSTPIPPPRAKARMKKVKRPTSRMIPPPPNIPLPPPPAKKAVPPADTEKADTTVVTATSPQPDKPGPVATSTPKPAPPKRISSLTPVAQVRSKIKRTEGAPLALSKETTNRTEPTAAARSRTMPAGQRSLKTTPPKRPPPPRPSNTISSQSASMPATAEPKSPPTAPPTAEPRSPPTAEPRSPPTAEPRSPPTAEPSRPPPTASVNQQPSGPTEAVRSRRSGLMGSLKKMVKRDSKKDIDKPTKAGTDGGHSSKPPPERPALPTSRSKSEKQISLQPLLSEENSPVPKPRSKKKSSVSSEPAQPQEPLKLSDAPSARSPRSSVSSQPPARPPQPQSQPVKSPAETSPPPRPSSSQTPARPPSQPVKSPTETSPPPRPSSSQTPARPPSQPVKSPTETSPPPRPSYIPRSSSAAAKSPTNSEQPPKTPSPPPQAEHRKSSSIPGKPKPPVAPKPSSLSSTPKSPTPQTFDLPEPNTEHTNGGVTQSEGRRSQSPTNFYRATKSYKAKADTELSFSAGDTLMFIEKKEGGFYYGMLDDGTTGLFPLDTVERFLK